MIDDALRHAIETVATRLAQTAQPVVLGLCGAQASGKSTLARALVDGLAAHGLHAATLSLDDIYLTRREREALARAVHPLFRTRGVPGTHDIALGLRVLAELDAGKAVALPRFDKATDDRAPPSAWGFAPAGTRVLILEGWCVGTRPQAEAALVDPVNDMEARHDPDGVWRRAVNAHLAGAYATLFARLDALVLLAAPGFEVVARWRIEQEHELRARRGGGMSDAEVIAFVQHYERLTRHMLAEMPGRADVVGYLDGNRGVRSVVLF